MLFLHADTIFNADTHTTEMRWEIVGVWNVDATTLSDQLAQAVMHDE